MSDAAPTTEPTSLATTTPPTTPTPDPAAPPPAADAAAPPTADAKPAETKPAEASVPLTEADLKFSEGFEVLPEARTSFLEIANKYGLSKDAVSDLVKLQESVSKTASEKGSEAWASMQTQWQTEAKADPVFAGEKFGPAIAEVGKLLDEYGSPELRQVMDLTGAGNNVHVLKFMHKMAGVLAEGRPVSGQPAAASGLSTEQKLYPSMNK